MLSPSMINDPDNLLDGLTDPQRDAAAHVDGPALVLARPLPGPGGRVGGEFSDFPDSPQMENRGLRWIALGLGMRKTIF